MTDEKMKRFHVHRLTVEQAMLPMNNINRLKTFFTPNDIKLSVIDSSSSNISDNLLHIDDLVRVYDKKEQIPNAKEVEKPERIEGNEIQIIRLMLSTAFANNENSQKTISSSEKKLIQNEHSNWIPIEGMMNNITHYSSGSSPMQSSHHTTPILSDTHLLYDEENDVSDHEIRYVLSLYDFIDDNIDENDTDHSDQFIDNFFIHTPDTYNPQIKPSQLGQLVYSYMLPSLNSVGTSDLTNQENYLQDSKKISNANPNYRSYKTRTTEVLY
ncbi:unnamed protein product [Didymodactylos carnosus]|uniref:Uncharacterized protein n=1 Tax=Didymodactylos carnosus TaxID=1234261 RepID=A0A815C725_9BILA|nr:unnamed protein product [Didymodactylos carnosus]CAF1451277.1 unnamed protein product [Didymodactylos carnosus]CAF4074649.1 unnamed protein product [Didymodactylos carnosus]CAF4245941.1 unnamed protein product [Didymodactylos carnosus]